MILNVTRRLPDGTQDVVQVSADAVAAEGFDPKTTPGIDNRTLEEAIAERIATIRQQAQERIEAAWPIHRQLNRLGDGTPEEIAAMRAEINTIRAASNAAQDAAAAAATNDEADAIVLTVLT